MQQKRYWFGETGGGGGSNIVMGKNGLPLFWKTWPALYKEAWLMGLRKRANQQLGFDLGQLIAEVMKRLQANQAKTKTERARIEREKWLAQVKKWDAEAKLENEIRAAVNRLHVRQLRPAAPVRRAVTR